MDYNKVQRELSDYQDEKVGVYIDYLKSIESAKDKQGHIKNKWFAYFKEQQAVSLYKKVAIDGLYIDGDTITLQFKGSVIVSYNYQAYKNKLLMVYPETLFDLQNVHEGDTFSFRKESGKVIYKHLLNDPFANKREIIGCYCIIKNNRGEFIETLNSTEITKMRNVAKTQSIWNAWEGEMTLKSVIKRACKRHFKDVTVNIEKIDNENYDVENVSLDYKVQEFIEKCENLDELGLIYDEYKGKVDDEPRFIELLSKKKAEIKQQAS